MLTGRLICLSNCEARTFSSDSTLPLIHSANIGMTLEFINEMIYRAQNLPELEGELTELNNRGILIGNLRDINGVRLDLPVTDYQTSLSYKDEQFTLKVLLTVEGSPQTIYGFLVRRSYYSYISKLMLDNSKETFIT